MEKMKLPIIRGIPKKEKWLSMDDYLKFVIFNLRCAAGKESSREWKKMLGVNVPFVLK